MRIVIDITTGEYKGRTFWQASVEHRAHERAGRFSQSMDFDTEHGAKLWCLDQTEEILLNTAQTDSVLSAPTYAHEARTVTAERCRCCNTLMRGSDHCPQCGCEEYEERDDCAMREPKLYTYHVRLHDGEEYGLLFQAEDEEHAREQAVDAEPNSTIISVTRQV